jgi:chemotaxis protein methyltransferase CheR
MTDNREYDCLLESINRLYGYDFKNYAEASLKRRMQLFMSKKAIESLTDLEHSLTGSEDTFKEFVEELSVTVTEMFRNPTFYTRLRETVVPRLVTYPFIKIWIAGCATGQEVYSLAIVLREAGLSDRSIIYATDINQKSLLVAKEGIYSVENMKLYTSNYQKSGGEGAFSDYYTASYGGVLFSPSLRENVVFAHHNLAIDQSFNEFQLILCRNVLIYFNQTLQNKVFNLFCESLCPFGFLGLGDKESLLFYDNKNLFEEIDRKEKVYRKFK